MLGPIGKQLLGKEKPIDEMNDKELYELRGKLLKLSEVEKKRQFLERIQNHKEYGNLA